MNTAHRDSPFLHRLISALAQKDRHVAEHAARVDMAARDAFATAFMERGEVELSSMLGEFLTRMAETDGIPDELRALYATAIDPPHQFGVLLQLITAVPALFTIAAQVANIEFTSTYQAMWADRATRVLSPAEAAVAVVKGHMTYATAENDAAGSGLNNERFNALYQSTGSAPGPETLMAMLRRGIIGDAGFATGIQQGLTRTEWTDELRALRYGPPSAAAAIIGAVQNHLSPDAARAIVGQDGIDPAHFEWMYQNAGRPPGIMQMVHLLNRGEVDQATVIQAIRESDIKDKYIDAMLQLRVYIPPVRTITAMARSGAISDAQATTLYHQNGVRDTDIAGYLAEAHHTKTATAATHHLTQGVIVEGYRNGALSRAQALAHLVELGYIEADATLMLDVADAQTLAQRHNAEVGRVRTLYLARKIARTTAAGDLDKLGVPAATRDAMLGEWDVIRVVPTRELSIGQLTQLHKRQLINDTEYGDRLVAMGYSPADADLLVSLSSTQLTVAQQQKAFKRGDLTEAQFRDRMAQRGIEPVDAGLLVRQTVENTAGVVP